MTLVSSVLLKGDTKVIVYHSDVHSLILGEEGSDMLIWELDHSGVRGVMVWVGVSSSHKATLLTLDVTVYAQCYPDNKINQVMVFYHEWDPETMFMQINDPTPLSRIVSKSLQEVRIQYLPIAST